MKPIAILQHDADVAAGSFEFWLRSRDLPYRIIRIDQGEAVPSVSAEYSGVCSLGGPMSVNDPLPWINEELELLRDADARGVPIIGHCLGGQMLAKALGAQVRRHRVKEIGWMPVEIEDIELGHEWLGCEDTTIEIFQWHGDAFELPHAARRFLSSPLCINQAFVVERAHCTHLGMQFHIEMTAQLVRLWLADPAGPAELEEERRTTGGVGVQDTAAMLEDLEQRCARMREFAEHVYDRWAHSLRR